MPEGSIVLYNENGTAPGIMIDENGKILVMLPGPPKELIPMFEKYVRPYLASKQEYMFVSRVLRIAKVCLLYTSTFLWLKIIKLI